MMEVITAHINADFDMIASMVAAKKLYPEAETVLDGSLEKSIEDSLKPLSTLEFKWKRAKDVDLDKIDRLILVDIRHRSRIGRFSKVVDRPGIEIHIYDHHPSTPEDIRGSLEVTHPYGSTTTILALKIKEERIAITEDEATLFMLGIYEDTGSLSYASTKVEDYEASAFLLSKGADLGRVASILKREITPEELHVLDGLIQSSTNYAICGVDVVIAETPAEGYTGQVSVLAHRMMEIENVDCLFILVGVRDRVHMVARSRTRDVNVGEVAQRIGGGGHPTAASATLKGVTPIQAREILINALKEHITPKKHAGEIMSAPPKTVSAETTIEAAREILTRYNINALPVVSSDDKTLAGVITRQVIEKAIYHSLGKAPVEDYMTIDGEHVTPRASIDKIRESLIGHGYRLLPVVEEGKVVGVITRTDLLRLYHEELVENPFSPSGAGRHRRKNIAKLMKERLPDWLVDLLKEAGNVAERLGWRIYAVGGFVRDLMLRRENLDIDLVIEGDGIAFAKEFASRRECRVRTHERFGTAVIIFPDGFKVDVATARLEYYERAGALPTVELSSLKLDLFRRDFTINTMAIELTSGRFGKLLDFFGGQRDIKERSIRVLHNLSFIEDPTRVFRAVRLSERFGFKIAAHTLKLIKNAAKIEAFRNIKGRRIVDELILILKEGRAVDSLKRLGELGLLKFIHPKITLDREGFFILERARDALSWYELLYKERPVEPWIVLFLALLDPLDIDELERFTGDMNISGRLRSLLLEGKGEGPKALIRIAERTDMRNSEINEILRPVSLEVLLYLMAKTGKEKTRKTISYFITNLNGIKTILNGRDLIKLGVPESPLCGRILDILLKKRLDGEIKTRDEEEKAAENLLKEGAPVG